MSVEGKGGRGGWGKVYGAVLVDSASFPPSLGCDLRATCFDEEIW